jgi:hypothetical protein
VTATSSTAAHLADLDARYDAHLSALRQHAAQLQATVARDAAALAAPEAGEASEPLS